MDNTHIRVVSLFCINKNNIRVCFILQRNSFFYSLLDVARCDKVTIYDFDNTIFREIFYFPSHLIISFASTVSKVGSYLIVTT